MNKLFYESLKAYSFHPFQLIIIDNASTDGSAEYFESVGAEVIRNTDNFSYPYTQNQGIAIATFQYFAFLNNDIIVAPNWDKLLIESMQRNGFDAITSCGLERIETNEKTKRLRLKWNIIRNAFKYLPKSFFNLRMMHRMMYPNWIDFNWSRHKNFNNQYIEGCLGHSVIVSRRCLELCGNWDERIQEADFDLYMRIKKRHIEHHDITPCMIDLGVFHHHYIRLTAKAKYKPFADREKLIPLTSKWTSEELSLLLEHFVKN
jgi:glycosyltransferase involved in cell wall biosynthesis